MLNDRLLSNIYREVLRTHHTGSLVTLPAGSSMRFLYVSWLASFSFSLGESETN
ncbi:hypothetical protein MK605_005094 [Escherichia coli]|uniref:hypothetical protein n=1 Tax=Escherichia coli TaxID=562 RepID=UPI000B13A244|nr:hypothetical protein [Escherichia coli]EIX7312351.1 hypothetical protein [Escherichia coli]EJO7378218.1 hypothetical protein [Escherichia coli]ELO5610425.1 hypothetical protein [Escherichia coli]HBC6892922.1 hypothetical protein [Escherichia coli]HDS7253973.1 hypothetical protein [Escherichia coli]